MGDSGEGLVDADARIQEQIEEREAERRRRTGNQPAIDPDKLREVESLKLARADLQRQQQGTSNPVRLKHIAAALAEIERRLSAQA
ncbi:MAG TPA: hypothetical protein VFK20_01025 [Vicinamibacterales bacterium]|nr:hypothetical protein [Vicinamibacterales bacterium]